MINMSVFVGKICVFADGWEDKKWDETSGKTCLLVFYAVQSTAIALSVISKTS